MLSLNLSQLFETFVWLKESDTGVRGEVRVSPNSAVYTLKLALYTVECTLSGLSSAHYGIVINLKGTIRYTILNA